MKTPIEIFNYLAHKITFLYNEYTQEIKKESFTEEEKANKEDYLKILDLRIKELEEVQNFILGEDK